MRIGNKSRREVACERASEFTCWQKKVDKLAKGMLGLRTVSCSAATASPHRTTVKCSRHSGLRVQARDKKQ